MGPTSELFTFCSKLPTAFVSSDASSSSSGVSGSQFQPQQEHQLSAISTKTTTLNSADKDAVEDEWHRDVWDEEEGNNSDGEEDNQELIGESYSSTAGVFIPSVQSILLSEPKTTVVTATTNNNRSINTEIQLKTSTSASSGANMPRTAVWKPVDLPPPKHSKSHKPTKKEVLLSPSTATSKNTQKLKVDTNITDGSSTVTIKKEALWKAIVSKLISYHGILPPNSELRFRVGKPPLISIIVEKRAGNKTVTRILNLELFYMDMNVLLKECRKKFACSVSLVDAVGNTKVGREVIIQGNFGPETEAMLIDTYGLSKTLIDLCMSKGIKPKRK